MKSLLDRARMERDGREYKATSEVVELSLAWARGEINTSQACKALGIKHRSSNVYIKLACGLREYIKQLEKNL
jgi:hypothetical protein